MQLPVESMLLDSQVIDFKDIVRSGQINLIIQIWQISPGLHSWYTGKPTWVVNSKTGEGNWVLIMGRDLIEDFRRLLSFGKPTSAIIKSILNNYGLLFNWYSGVPYIYCFDDLSLPESQTISLYELSYDFMWALKADINNFVEFIWNKNRLLREWYAGTSLINDQDKIINSVVPFKTLVESFELAANQHPLIALTMLDGIKRLYLNHFRSLPDYQAAKIMKAVIDNYEPAREYFIASFLSTIENKPLLNETILAIKLGFNYKTATTYKEKQIALLTQRINELEQDLIIYDSSPIVCDLPSSVYFEEELSDGFDCGSSVDLLEEGSIDLELNDCRQIIKGFRMHLASAEKNKISLFWFHYPILHVKYSTPSELCDEVTRNENDIISFQDLIEDFRLVLACHSNTVAEAIWNNNKAIQKYYKVSTEAISDDEVLITDFRNALANGLTALVSVLINRVPKIIFLFIKEPFNSFEIPMADIISGIKSALRSNSISFIKSLLTHKEKLKPKLAQIRESDAVELIILIIGFTCKKSLTRELITCFETQRIINKAIEKYREIHRNQKIPPRIREKLDMMNKFGAELNMKSNIIAKSKQKNSTPAYTNNYPMFYSHFNDTSERGGNYLESSSLREILTMNETENTDILQELHESFSEDDLNFVRSQFSS